MALSRRLTAEFFGTFWLVFGGCGSAVLAAAFPALGIGFAGVALAFGLTVLTMVYALGPISGGHFNPAVTVGLWCAKRFAAKDVLPYIIVQVVGAIAAAAVLYVIASGKDGFSLSGGFASNGYGEHSPGQYSMVAALVAEFVLTFGFLDGDLGRDRQARTRRIRRHRHRPSANADPSDLNPSRQHLSQPRPQHRPRPLRRRLGPRPTLALLASPPSRRRSSRLHLQSPTKRRITNHLTTRKQKARDYYRGLFADQNHFALVSERVCELRSPGRFPIFSKKPGGRTSFKSFEKTDK